MEKIFLFHVILFLLFYPTKVYSQINNPAVNLNYAGYQETSLQIPATTGTIQDSSIYPDNRNISQELEPIIHDYLIDTGRTLDILSQIIDNLFYLISDNIYSVEDVGSIFSNDLTSTIEPDIADFLNKDTLDLTQEEDLDFLIHFGYLLLQEEDVEQVTEEIEFWKRLTESIPFTKIILGEPIIRDLGYTKFDEGITLRYNLTQYISNSAYFPLLGSALARAESLSFELQSSVRRIRGQEKIEATEEFQIGFKYIDDNGDEQIILKRFDELAPDIELSGECQRVEIDLSSFDIEDWSKVTDFVLYFDQNEMSSEMGSLYFKDLSLDPKEGFEEDILTSGDLNTALTISRLLNRSWDLTNNFDLDILYDIHSEGYEELNKFINLKTAQEIIDYIGSNFGFSFSEIAFLSPNYLLDVLNHNTPSSEHKPQITSLDAAYWEALMLTKNDYEVYILATLNWKQYELNSELQFPAWNFTCTYRDKISGQFSLIEQDKIIETSFVNIQHLKDSSEYKNYLIAPYNFDFSDTKKQLLEQYFSTHSFTEEYQRNYVEQLLKENIYYFQEGVGVDPNTHLPYDFILFDNENSILDKGRYTQPPVIGMYLALLASIAKGDVDTSNISQEEALIQLKNSLETIQNMPKWNGLLYNWYKADSDPIQILGTSETGDVRIVLYEEGYFTASLSLVIGAFIGEEQSNPLIQQIVDLANNIMDEQREGWRLLCRENDVPAFFTIEWGKVAENVKNILAEQGNWNKILPLLEKEVSSSWLFDSCEVLFTNILKTLIVGYSYNLISAEQIPIENIERSLKEIGLSEHIKDLGIEAMQRYENGRSSLDDYSSGLNDLYMDGRTAVLAAYMLGAVEEEAWFSLNPDKISYTLSSNDTIEIWRPYNGAFQAWENLLFFPEIDWSPYGFSIAHKNYALTQTDFAYENDLPALFSAASNPYFQENEGLYSYAWDLGIPGASSIQCREENLIATPHATALLYLIEPEQALELLATLELTYPAIKGPLGWKDSLGLNGEVSNTFLGLDQLFLLLALNGHNNHTYMINYLEYIGKLSHIERLFKQIHF